MARRLARAPCAPHDHAGPLPAAPLYALFASAPVHHHQAEVVPLDGDGHAAVVADGEKHRGHEEGDPGAEEEQADQFRALQDELNDKSKKRRELNKAKYEIERLKRAIEESKAQLVETRERVAGDMGESYARIFEDGDGCSADCLSREVCGNGIHDVAAGEECDDGNTGDGDGCSSDCRFESTSTAVPALPKPVPPTTTPILVIPISFMVL